MTPALLDPPSAEPAVRRDRPAVARRRARLPAPAGRFVLYGIDWPTYRRLREAPEHAGYRFTFDGPTGRLEVEVSQGTTHEAVSRLLSYFVMVFRQQGGPRFWPTGAVTLAREDLDRGLECDESFYVTRVADAPPMGTNLIDLSGGQPPPDLAVEVDMTSAGVDKLPIYAALGVPEVWVWDDEAGSLTARRLTGAGDYASVAESVELPGFPLAFAAELLRDPGDRDAGELQAAFAARLGS